MTESSMKVRVKLFAVARQRMGQEAIDVELPDSATVRQLRGALVEQFPPLADVLAHARIAVANEYAADAATIPASAEIALIPPVSGG
jgi:molybdopterin synthase catalytic subunit